MKAKSMKLRTLITLHALYKHTDEKHRLNTPKLNKFLQPYGLECTKRVLTDTAKVLQDYGIDIQFNGEWEKQGFWVKNRPLSDEALKKIIFAVTTNPNISKNDAENILKALTPIVTVYQEPLLKSYVENTPEVKIDDCLYDKYIVICEAISSKRRVKYWPYKVKYDKDTDIIYMSCEWPTLFTPKCIQNINNKLYMVGYNNTDKMIEAVELQSIANVELAFKHKDPKAAEVQQILKDLENGPKQVDFTATMQNNRGKLIYKGKVIFKCRYKYLAHLYRLFGEPAEPVNRNVRHHYTYTVSEAEIWADTLFELSKIPSHSMCIVGPEEFTKSVSEYYEKTASLLTTPDLPRNCVEK